MPVINRIAAFAPEMAEWRQHLHAHPELGLDCPRTAAFVAARLRAFGVDEVHEGIGGCGVVAILHGRGTQAAEVTGLRADMDALPIHEASAQPHASRSAGRMHACGHDGHTAMLLGAARYLAETRNFSGRVALIFQPGEEIGQGARAMLQDGLMQRFGISRVFALHTAPGAPLGSFATRPGPMLAAMDLFDIRITGRGAHAAHPETGIDPLAAGLQIASALMTVVPRNVAALAPAVLSISAFHAGETHNVMPETAELRGTVRSHDRETQALIERRMGEIVAGMAAAMNVQASLGYQRRTAVTVNEAQAVEQALAAARMVSSDVSGEAPPIMAGEDFSWMLHERPGAFVSLGQGPGPALHNDRFDFNDAVAPFGASFHVRLVESLQPL